jgi:hypothetical protein
LFVGGQRDELFALGFGPGAFGGKAAAGHDGAALDPVTPACGELEGFVEVGVEREIEGAEE